MGRVAPDVVARALRDDTLVVSVMAANNEIGVLQPIREIADLCRERGVAFHSDAAQAVGKLELSIERDGIDLLSLSGHKLYGPKGIGVLAVRKHGKPRLRLGPSSSVSRSGRPKHRASRGCGIGSSRSSRRRCRGG
jgi:cysteine desulfurase